MNNVLKLAARPNNTSSPGSARVARAQRRTLAHAILSVLLIFATVGCSDDDLFEVSSVTIDTHVDDWRDEVIYQLLTDRFANGTRRNDFRVDASGLGRYQGGDYQGIIDNLDYLEDLGVTALWISPIVRNVDTDAGVDGYHGYWQVDLERLNPHFGDLATLRAMVNAAHDRGIKVIVDIVTNHMGQVFYYDINLNGRPDENVFGSGTTSPLQRVTEYDPDYDRRGIQSFTSLGEAGPAPIKFFDMPDIFRVPPNPPIFRQRRAYNLRGRVTSFDEEDQVIYGDFPGGLKDINTENEDVREEITRVFTEWVLKTDIDGFRIDTLKHVDNGFWEYFAPEVRERLARVGKDNFLMFGEAFDGRDDLVGSFTMPGRIDSVFYFPQKFQVFDDVFKNGAPTSKIEELFDQRSTNYGTEPQDGGIGVAPTDALVNFIDNHDLPRYLFELDNKDVLHASLAYLLTQDGIPCIYYGTEQDFDGGNDPANREVLWQTGFDRSGETFQWISTLTQIRRTYPALRRGDFRIRYTSERNADEEDAGIVAFERTDGESYALVVINANHDQASSTSFEGVDMIVGQSSGTTLRDALTGESYDVASGDSMNITIDPLGVVILVPEDDYEALF